MKKNILIISLFLSVNLFAEPLQGWTKVSCPSKNHEDIYEFIMFFVKYFEGDIGYNDGHKLNAYITLPSDNCYEAIHILNVEIYDGSFIYNLEQSLQFGEDFEACASEVREQVKGLETILQNIEKM